MNGDDPLQKLDPAYVQVMRITTSILAVPPLAGAIALETASVLPMGSILLPVLAVLIGLVWKVPLRRYRRWGYIADNDRLRIERGFLFYSDTVVPFGRIQHIDVDQGPIERRYELATLSVHTAGTHGSTISLPGLRHEDALMLRESIRDHIKRAAG
jgi:uncharacterized protein